MCCVGAASQRLDFQQERGAVRELGAWQGGGLQGERQPWNDGEYCKNKIAKREAGSEWKIAQEIKIDIKAGEEQWRESGQSQRDDKGDLLTEEVFKNSFKRNINQGLKQPDAKMEMLLRGGRRNGDLLK